jgi:glycosyltransferase involved in cell wall biosynthesis
MKRALLVNWDNYPNVTSGGVYTWAKSLVENMPDWEFVVFNQLSNPNANAGYAVQTNVKQVIEMPIFGTNRYEEYYDDRRPFIPKMRATSESVVEGGFLPLYDEFLENILGNDCEPQKLAESISKLHRFLVTYDSKKCFEHHLTWEIFLNRIKNDRLYREMRLREALGNFQALQRSMQVLSIELPKVDIIHCSLAWLPAAVAIPAKLKDDTPILVTEHGVAFRELVLYYNTYLYNEPSRIFWTVFTRNVVRTIYTFADKIAPVCHANESWELSLGVEKSKIKVIYNGIDTKRFRPIAMKREAREPTVVSVSRVSVFKDIVNLIQAISYVRESIGSIRCLVYGSSTETEYSARCMDLVQSLGLGANFKFMGETKKPEEAYNLADVVAFSSLTEGFPFGVIEAMACGKAVVATDVGGVREALEGCGLLVRSRRPHDLADGIITLLRDERMRHGFEKAALERTMTEFSLEKEVREYAELYDELTGSPKRGDYLSRPREVVVAR